MSKDFKRSEKIKKNGDTKMLNCTAKFIHTNKLLVYIFMNHEPISNTNKVPDVFMLFKIQLFFFFSHVLHGFYRICTNSR